MTYVPKDRTFWLSQASVALRNLQPDTIESGAEDIPVNPSLLWRLVHLNPVLWRGLLLAVAGVLVTVGVVFSGHAQEAIYTLILSVVAIVQAVWTKGSVVPNKKVVVYKPDPVESPRELASGEAVSTNAADLLAKAASIEPIPDSR